MKKILFAIFSLTLLFAAFPSHSFAAELEKTRVTVKFKPLLPDFVKEIILNKAKYNDKTALLLDDTFVLTVPSGQAELIANQLSKNPQVEYAEVDATANASYTPNDPYLGNQWGISKVDAYGAWNATKGSTDTNIAIIDSGIDQNHPEFSGRIIGRSNFTTDPDVDNRGHGTHVAGITAANANNGTGIAGVDHNAKLMSVKVLDSNGNGYYSWIANGIVWATDNGADIINMSLSGTSASSVLQDAVQYADSQGVLMIVAAGNNNTSTAPYPAAYSETLSVAATTSSDSKASFSNYGSWVDIAAPGYSILSTVPGNSYEYYNGTSMAAPFVTGVAGLIHAQHPDWTSAQIRSKLESSADAISLTGYYWQNGRLNACKAVDCNITPTPTVVPTATPTTAPTAAPTPTVAPTATPTPTVAPTIAPTATPIPTIAPTATPIPTIAPTATPVPTAIPTATPTPTVAPTATPFPTATPTLAPTNTPFPTATTAPTPTPNPSLPWWCAYFPTLSVCR